MRSKAIQRKANIELVSFIVPAWNEEAILGSTLEALRRAGETLPVRWEIIVADDASTDGTAEIAREAGARVVSIKHRQIAATRNVGARAAHGDLLIFVDADTWVTPEVVRAALDAVQAGAVGGGCAVRFDGPVPCYARVGIPVFCWIYRQVRLAAGCFLFCTREAFEAVGGFNETLYASEECWVSLALRRHGRFVILREAVLTSARKLRTFSGREILRMALHMCRNGLPRSREAKGMEMWYGPRRPDPG